MLRTKILIMIVVTSLIMMLYFVYRIGNAKNIIAPVVSVSKQRSEESSSTYVTTIKVGQYNIHRGKGDDNKKDLLRIINEIKKYNLPDFLALNEITLEGIVFTENQAKIISKKLGLNVIFSPTESRWFRQNTGNALIHGIAINQWFSVPLPNQLVVDDDIVSSKSPRNYVVYYSYVGSKQVIIINTHLDTSPLNAYQMQFVLDVFKNFTNKFDYVLLMGDFNVYRDNIRMKNFINKNPFIDVINDRHDQELLDGREWIISYGFKTKNVTVGSIGASDHGYYMAELELQ